MEYRFFGASGVRVSSLALGAMGFGSPALDAEGAARQVGMALDAGVNLFDTADSYNGGRSEELLGRALAGRRDEVLVSTKAHARSGRGVNDVGQSRWHLMAACEASLRRLGTDHIDVYHVHGFDACTPLEESLSALDRLVRDGKVRYLACSNQAAWQTAKALGLSAARGWHSFSGVQAYYSLVARELEWDVLPMCRAEGLGVLVWSPLSGGLLTDKVGTDGAAPAGTRRAQIGDLALGPIDYEVAARVLGLCRRIAHERGVSVAQVALNWVGGQEAVSSVIVGARTPEQLADNLAAATWSLSADELAELSSVSERPLPYPHWFQRQFTAERFSRAGAPEGAYRYGAT